MFVTNKFVALIRHNAPVELIAMVPVTDLDRAALFYGATLGLTEQSRDAFAVVFRVGGTMLRVTKVDGLRPQPFTVLGWAVPDIDAAVADLAARGVTVTRYDGMGQDDNGIWTAPGGDRITWFTDPDGNNLSLTQFA